MIVLGRLFHYFGITGFLSVVLWIGSLGLLAWGSVSRRRTRLYWLAAAVGLTGVLFGMGNTWLIDRIAYDLTQPRQQGVAEGNAMPSLPDSPDIAGAPPTALEGRPYDYRARGKIERNSNARKDEDQDERVPGLETEDDSEPKGRTMNSVDAERATRYGSVNMFFAWFSLGLGVTLGVADYLVRLNRTVGFYCPLPLASHVLDTLAPKTHSVRMQASADAVRVFLENVVKKGETFIYFGQRDLWEAVSLPRLELKGHSLYRLDKVTCVGDGEPFNSDDVFESAWFSRYCFVVKGLELSRPWLSELEAFLVRRQSVRATARKTVNIVWDLDDTLIKDRLDELLFLCRETNHKFILIGGSCDAGRFDEDLEMTRSRR